LFLVTYTYLLWVHLDKTRSILSTKHFPPSLLKECHSESFPLARQKAAREAKNLDRHGIIAVVAEGSIFSNNISVMRQKTKGGSDSACYRPFGPGSRPEVYLAQHYGESHQETTPAKARTSRKQYRVKKYKRVHYWGYGLCPFRPYSPSVKDYITRSNREE